MFTQKPNKRPPEAEFLDKHVEIRKHYVFKLKVKAVAPYDCPKYFTYAYVVSDTLANACAYYDNLSDNEKEMVLASGEHMMVPATTIIEGTAESTVLYVNK